MNILERLLFLLGVGAAVFGLIIQIGVIANVFSTENPMSLAEAFLCSFFMAVVPMVGGVYLFYRMME